MTSLVKRAYARKVLPFCLIFFKLSTKSFPRLCNDSTATLHESATTDIIVGEDGKTSRSLTPEETFHLDAFGVYSQRFSFGLGSGLPGLVYATGRCAWQQSVHNTPDDHFERRGGAFQFGIKSAVAIPIASPKVGRIVVVLYSCLDRPKDEDMVAKLSNEMTRVSNICRVDPGTNSQAFHSNVIFPPSFFNSCSLFQLPNGSLSSMSLTKMSLLSVVLPAPRPLM